MAVASSTCSLEQFLELPEETPELEYFDGTVSQKVLPRGQHSTLQAAMTEYLTHVARPRNLGRAFPELRSTFGGASCVPDVSFYLREHIPLGEKGRIANDFRQPPDIAVEIVSPGQSSTTLVRRCMWYVHNGVTIALLVDPDDDSVLAFRADEPLRALRGDDRLDLHEVLPEFDVSVTQLFQSLVME
jgi:Uma2 family endonuclease